MKLQYLLPIIIPFFLASCTEKNTPIDDVVIGGSGSSDTSYMATVEMAQKRVVLVEEFTGVSCSNCPQGHTVLDNIEASNAGQIAAMGIQINGFSLCDDVYSQGHNLTRHDNRTAAGTDLVTAIYGSVNNMPVAGIDRIANNGVIATDRANWPTLVAGRIAVAPNVNVTLTSSYSTGDTSATIKVHIAYTKDVAKKQKLTVAIVEDSVIDAQEDGIVIDSNYTHMHVLRDIITAHGGSTILSGTTTATKAAGQVYEQTFVYKMNTLWVPQHCKVIAFVSDDESNDLEVQQAAMANVK